MKEIGLRKQPDGHYQVRLVKAIVCNTTGKREDIVRKRSNIKTLGEARFIRSQLQIEIQEEHHNRKQGISDIQQLIANFIEMRGNGFSPSTLMGMKQNFERYLRPIHSNLVTKISRSQVEDLLQVHKSRVSDTTLNRVATDIRSLFNFAMERGMIKENPAQHIRFGTKKAYDRQLNAMNRSEIKKLLAESTNHPFHSIFFVAYHTGARAGELVELKFSDFDFENKTLTISRSRCSKTKVVKKPKNGRSRTFHLNDELISHIQSLKQNSTDTDYVLPREKQFLRGETAKVLKALQKEIGIKPTNFHSIRASFITHLLLADVPITKVQSIVGHADLKTTQAYVRLSASDLVGATDSLQNPSSQMESCDVATNVIPLRPKSSSPKTVRSEF